MAIDIKNVSKSFVTKDKDFMALKDVNLHVDDGELICLLGPSGCGKTTLLRMVAGLETPDCGEIYDRGELVEGPSKERGFIFQQYNLIQSLSVLENVELPLLYQGVDSIDRREMAMEALGRVGLAERWRNKPTQMSGGQQQRVAIARAIATQPPIIMADEPTGALDSRTGLEVLHFLQQLNREGSTIILITHDNGIAATARRIVRLADGKIVEDREQEVDWL